jgi:cilia- and flagella-associated protein 65
MFSTLAHTSVTINEYGDKEDVIIISAEERLKRFGIEVASFNPLLKGNKNGSKAIPSEGVSYLAGTWQPGGEYTQKLIIRNVSTNVKKLKYKLPSTEYFSMLYPEAITLSPGLSYEIAVVFKPIKYESYDDCILFTIYDVSGKHQFFIPVSAKINKLELQCPETLEFGYCSVSQVTEKSFDLVNVGEVDAPFGWSIAEPFQIKPQSGTIPVGQSMRITMSILPSNASVYVSKSTCHVGENVTAIIPNPVISVATSAIAKYAHLAISDSDINFGDVVTGKSTNKIIHKEFVLRNTTTVPADYRLQRVDDDCDSMFEITPKSGRLEAMSEVVVHVTYKPLAYGKFSLERYQFITPSNHVTTFVCRGKSISAVVKYSKDHYLISPPSSVNSIISPIIKKPGSADILANCFDFGDVEIGQSATKTLYLRNDSDEDVTYDIQSESQGIFRIMSAKRGKIGAMSSTTIQLVFDPKHAMNYYRRIFVLLSSNHPFFYDCFGTAYIRGDLVKGLEEHRPAPLKYEHIQAYRNRLVQGCGHINPDEIFEIFRSNRQVESTSPMRSLVARRSSYAEMMGTGKLFDANISTATLGSTCPLEISTVKHPLTRSGEATRDVLAVGQEYFIDNHVGTKDHGPADDAHIITVSHNALNFGLQDLQTVSSCQYITVMNNSNGNVTAVWELPSSSAYDIYPMTIELAAKQSEVFELRFKPIAPMKNGIHYEELELYCYFSNQKSFRYVKESTLTPPWCRTLKVHGYSSASVLNMKNSCIRISNGNIDKSKLEFPPCFVGDSIYQSMVLHNSSSQDVVYSCKALLVDHQEIFSIQPEVGFIPANGYAIVYAKFHPLASTRYSQAIQISLNTAAIPLVAKDGKAAFKKVDTKEKAIEIKDVHELVLEGHGGRPYAKLSETTPRDVSVQLSEDSSNEVVLRSECLASTDIPQGFQGDFFMVPTCIGLLTSRGFPIHNPSRLPLRFQVIIDGKYLLVNSRHSLLTIAYR